MTNEKNELVSVIARHARNAISLLTSDVLNKATTFFIYLLVARYFGARTLGQLSLSLMLFYVFQVFATAGLPTIVTRAIAQRPGRTDRYCLNGLAAACLGGSIATLALVALTIVLRYEKDTTLLICLVGLGVAPYGLALILESVFRGRECMHYIAIANLVANTGKVLGAVFLLRSGYDIFAIAFLLVGIRWLIFLLEMSLYVGCLKQSRPRVQFRFVRRLLQHSLTFLGIDAVIASWQSVNVLLLSKLATEVEVGVFSAAVQILQPVSLINRSIVSAVFPAMCKSAIGNVTKLVEITRWLVTFLILVGMPAVVFLFLFAGPLLTLCYGRDNMQESIPLIQITASSLVIGSITAVFGNALWAVGRERAVLRIVTVNFAINVILGFFLIRFYGVSGAAWTLLLIAIFNGVQHWYASRQVLEAEPLDRTILIPLCAGGLMCLPILMFYGVNQATALASGILVYLGVIAVLLRRKHGTVKGLSSRYFAPLLNS